MNVLKASFYYPEPLHRSRVLDDVYAVLLAHAPTWCSSLKVGHRPGHVPVLQGPPGALRGAIERESTRRGPRYYEVVKMLGSVPFERASGSAEVLGSYPALLAVVSIDDYLLAPTIDGQRWGNHIALHLPGSRIEGVPSDEWLATVFEELCLATAPVYAEASTDDEWSAQNLDTSNGMEAIGVGLAAAVPGLYWLNYLGEPYRDLIDVRALHGLPLARASELGSGYLVQIDADSEAWGSSACQNLARATRLALGEDLFFDRRHRDRATRAPRFADLLGAGTVEARGQTAVLAKVSPDR